MVSVGKHIILSLISVGHTCSWTYMPRDKANRAKRQKTPYTALHLQ